MLPYQLVVAVRGTFHSQARLLLRSQVTAVAFQFRNLCPMSEYEKRVSSGQLMVDTKQRETMQALDKLFKRIKGYQPSTQSSSSGGGFFGRLFGSKSNEDDPEDDLNAGSHAPKASISTVVWVWARLHSWICSTIAVRWEMPCCYSDCHNEFSLLSRLTTSVVCTSPPLWRMCTPRSTKPRSVRVP